MVGVRCLVSALSESGAALFLAQTKAKPLVLFFCHLSVAISVDWARVSVCWCPEMGFKQSRPTLRDRWSIEWSEAFEEALDCSVCKGMTQ